MSGSVRSGFGAPDDREEKGLGTQARQYRRGGEGMGQRFDVHVSEGKVYLNGQHAPGLLLRSRRDPSVGGDNARGERSRKGEEFFLVEVDPTTGAEKSMLMGLVSNGDGSFRNVTGVSGLGEAMQGMDKLMAGRLGQMVGGMINAVSPFGRGLIEGGGGLVEQGTDEASLGAEVQRRAAGVSPEEAVMSMTESLPMFGAAMGVGRALKPLVGTGKAFVGTTAGMAAGEVRSEHVQMATDQAKPGEEPRIPSRGHLAMPAAVSGLTALVAPTNVQRFMTGQVRQRSPGLPGPTTRGGLQTGPGTPGQKSMVAKATDMGAYEGMQEVPEEYSQYLATKMTDLDTGPVSLDESLEIMAIAGISGAMTGGAAQGAFKVFGLTGDALVGATRKAGQVMRSLTPGLEGGLPAGRYAGPPRQGEEEGEAVEADDPGSALVAGPDLFDPSEETGSSLYEDILGRDPIEEVVYDNVAAAQGTERVKEETAERLGKFLPPKVAKGQADEMIDSALRIRNAAGSFEAAQEKVAGVQSADQWKTLTGMDHTDRGWEDDRQDMLTKVMPKVKEHVHPEYARALQLMDEVEGAKPEERDTDLDAKRLLYYMALDRRKPGEDMKAAIVRMSNEDGGGGISRVHANLSLALANMRFGEDVARAAPFLALEMIAQQPDITPSGLVQGILGRLVDDTGQIRKDGMLGAFEIGGLHNLFMKLEGPVGDEYRATIASFPEELQSSMQGEALAKVSKGALAGVSVPGTHTSGKQWRMHAIAAMDRRDRINHRFGMLLQGRGNDGAKFMSMFGEDHARLALDPTDAVRSWKENVKARAAGWLSLYKAVTSTGRKKYPKGIPPRVVEAEKAGIFVKVADYLVAQPEVKEAMDALNMPKDAKHRIEAVLPLMPTFVKAMVVKAEGRQPQQVDKVDVGSKAAKEARAEARKRKKKDTTPKEIKEARLNWRMGRGSPEEGDLFGILVMKVNGAMGTGRGTLAVSMPEEAAIPTGVAMAEKRGFQAAVDPLDTRPGDIVFGMTREEREHDDDDDVQKWTFFRGRVVDNSDDAETPREGGWIMLETGKNERFAAHIDNIPQGALWTGADEKTSGVHWGARVESPQSVEHKVGFAQNLEDRLAQMGQVPGQETEAEPKKKGGRPPLSEGEKADRSKARAAAANVTAAAQQQAEKTKGKAAEQAKAVVEQAKGKAAEIVEGAKKKAAAVPQPAPPKTALSKRETETRARYGDLLASAEARLDALAKTRPTDSDELTSDQLALHQEQASLELADAREALEVWDKPTPGHGRVVNEHITAANKKLRQMQEELNKAVGKKAVTDAVQQAEQARLQAEAIRDFAGEKARFEKLRGEVGDNLTGKLGKKVKDAEKTALTALANAEKDKAKTGKLRAAIDKYEQAAERHRSAKASPVEGPVKADDDDTGKVSEGAYAHRESDRKMRTRWNRLVSQTDPFYMDARATPKSLERDAKVKEADDLLERISSQEKPSKKDIDKFGSLMKEAEALHKDYLKSDESKDRMTMATGNLEKNRERIDRTRENIREFMTLDLSGITEGDRGTLNAEIFDEAHGFLAENLKARKPGLLRAKVRKMSALASEIRGIVEDTGTPMSTRLRNLDPLLAEHAKVSASLQNELRTRKDDGSVDLTGYIDATEADAPPVKKPRPTRQVIDEDIAPNLSELRLLVAEDETNDTAIESRLEDIATELSNMQGDADVLAGSDNAPTVEALKAAVKDIDAAKKLLSQGESADKIRARLDKVATGLGFSAEKASLPDALSQIRHHRSEILRMKRRASSFPQISQMGMDIVTQSSDVLLAVAPHHPDIGKRTNRIESLRDRLRGYIKRQLAERDEADKGEMEAALHIARGSKKQRQEYLESPEGKARTKFMNDWNAYERILREAENSIASVSWEADADSAHTRRENAKDHIKRKFRELKGKVDRIVPEMRQHPQLVRAAAYLVKRHKALKAFHAAVSDADVVPDIGINELMFRWGNAAQELSDRITMHQEMLDFIDEGVIPDEKFTGKWPRKEEAVLKRARQELFQAVNDMGRIERVLDHDGWVSGIFKTARVEETTLLPDDAAMAAQEGKTRMGKGKRRRDAREDPKTGLEYPHLAFSYAFPIRDPDAVTDWDKAKLTDDEKARLTFTGRLYKQERHLRWMLKQFPNRETTDKFKKDFIAGIAETNKLVNQATEWAETNLTPEQVTPLHTPIGAGRGPRRQKPTMESVSVESGIGKLNRQEREKKARAKKGEPEPEAETAAEPEQPKAKKPGKAASVDPLFGGFEASTEQGEETVSQALDAQLDEMDVPPEDRDALKKLLKEFEKAKQKPETPWSEENKRRLDEYVAAVDATALIDHAEADVARDRGRKHISVEEAEAGKKGAVKPMIDQRDKYLALLKGNLAAARVLQIGHPAANLGEHMNKNAISLMSALKQLRIGRGQDTHDIDEMWETIGHFDRKRPTGREYKTWKKEQRKKQEAEARAELEKNEAELEEERQRQEEEDRKRAEEAEFETDDIDDDDDADTAGAGAAGFDPFSGFEKSQQENVDAAGEKEIDPEEQWSEMKASLEWVKRKLDRYEPLAEVYIGFDETVDTLKQVMEGLNGLMVAVHEIPRSALKRLVAEKEELLSQAEVAVHRGNVLYADTHGAPSEWVEKERMKTDEEILVEGHRALRDPFTEYKARVREREAMIAEQKAQREIDKEMGVEKEEYVGLYEWDMDSKTRGKIVGIVQRNLREIMRQTQPESFQAEHGLEISRRTGAVKRGHLKELYESEKDPVMRVRILRRMQVQEKQDLERRISGAEKSLDRVMMAIELPMHAERAISKDTIEMVAGKLRGWRTVDIPFYYRGEVIAIHEVREMGIEKGRERDELDVLASRFKSKEEFNRYVLEQVESLHMIYGEVAKKRMEAEAHMREQVEKAKRKHAEKALVIGKMIETEMGNLKPAQRKRLEQDKGHADIVRGQYEAVMAEREKTSRDATEQIEEIIRDKAKKPEFRQMKGHDAKIEKIREETRKKLDDLDMKAHKIRERVTEKDRVYMEAKAMYDELFYTDEETGRDRLVPRDEIPYLLGNPNIPDPFSPGEIIAREARLTAIGTLLGGKFKDMGEVISEGVLHLRPPSRQFRFRVYRQEVLAAVTALKKEKKRDAARMLEEELNAVLSEEYNRRFSMAEQESELRRLVNLARSPHAQDISKLRQIQARREGKILPKSVTTFAQELALQEQETRRQKIIDGTWKAVPMHIREANMFVMGISKLNANWDNMSVGQRYGAQTYLYSLIGGKTRKQNEDMFLGLIWAVKEEKVWEAPTNPFERDPDVSYSSMNKLKGMIAGKAKAFRQTVASYAMAEIGENISGMEGHVKTRRSVMNRMAVFVQTYLDHTNMPSHNLVGVPDDDDALVGYKGEFFYDKLARQEKELVAKIGPDAGLVHSALVVNISPKARPQRFGKYDPKKLSAHAPIPGGAPPLKRGRKKKGTTIGAVQRTSRLRRIPDGPVTKNFVYDHALSISTVLNSIKEQGRDKDWPHAMRRIEQAIGDHVRESVAAGKKPSKAVELTSEDAAALHRVLNNEVIAIREQKATIPDGYDERSVQNVIMDLGSLAGQRAPDVKTDAEPQAPAREKKFGLVSLTLDTDSPRVARVRKSHKKARGLDRLSEVFVPGSTRNRSDHAEVIDNGDGTYSVTVADMPRGGKLFRNMSAADATDVVVSAIVAAGFDKKVRVSDVTVGDWVAGGIARPIVGAMRMSSALEVKHEGDQAEISKKDLEVLESAGYGIGNVEGMASALESQDQLERLQLRAGLVAERNKLTNELKVFSNDMNLKRLGVAAMGKRIMEMRKEIKALDNRIVDLTEASRAESPVGRVRDTQNSWIVSGKVEHVDAKTGNLRVRDKYGQEHMVATMGSVYMSSHTPKSLANSLPDVRKKSRVSFNAVGMDPVKVFAEYAGKLGWHNYAVHPRTAMTFDYGGSGYLSLVDEGGGDYSIHVTSAPLSMGSMENASRTGEIVGVIPTTEKLAETVRAMGPLAMRSSDLPLGSENRPAVFRGSDLDPIEAEYELTRNRGYEHGYPVGDLTPGQKVMFVALLEGLVAGELNALYEAIEGTVTEMKDNSLVVMTPMGSREVAFDDILSDHVSVPHLDEDGGGTSIGSATRVRRRKIGSGEAPRKGMHGMIARSAQSIKPRKARFIQDRGPADIDYVSRAQTDEAGIDYDYLLAWRVPEHIKEGYNVEFPVDGMEGKPLERTMLARMAKVAGSEVHENVAQVFVVKLALDMAKGRDMTEARGIIKDQIRYLAENFEDAAAHVNAAEGIAILSHLLILTDPKHRDLHMGEDAPQKVRNAALAGKFDRDIDSVTEILNVMGATQPLMSEGSDIPFVYNVTNRIKFALIKGKGLAWKHTACTYQALGNVFGMDASDIYAQEKAVMNYLHPGDSPLDVEGMDSEVFELILKNNGMRRIELTPEMKVVSRVAALSKAYGAVMIYDSRGHVFSAVNGVMLNTKPYYHAYVTDVWVPTDAARLKTMAHLPSADQVRAGKSEQHDVDASQAGRQILMAAIKSAETKDARVTTLLDMKGLLLDQSRQFVEMMRELKADHTAGNIDPAGASATLRDQADLMTYFVTNAPGMSNMRSENRLFSSLAMMLNNLSADQKFTDQVGPMIDYMENLFIPDASESFDAAMRLGQEKGVI